MDEFIKEKRSTRRLTEEEDQDSKRQRRLVKNRVSALASRNRKKEETELMEDQVTRLRKENMIQREQIARLDSENESLKKEMVHLNRLLLGNGYLNTDLLTEMVSSISPMEQPTSKVAGIAVMVLLFSFGALLGPFSFQDPGMNAPALIPLQPLSAEPLRRKQRDILQVGGDFDSSAAISSVPQPNPSSPVQLESVPIVAEIPTEQINSQPSPYSHEASQKNNSETQDNVLIQMIVPRSIFSSPPSSPQTQVPALISTSVPSNPTTSSLSPSANIEEPSSLNATVSNSASKSSCNPSTWHSLPSNFVEVSCHLFQIGGNHMSKLKA